MGMLAVGRRCFYRWGWMITIKKLADHFHDPNTLSSNRRSMSSSFCHSGGHRQPRRFCSRIRSSNTEHINCLTIGTNTGGGQAGGEQVFDNLLNRKYSKVKTIKSAFAILSLVKWYLCKVKLLQKLPQTEKDLKLTKMKKSLSVRREQKPFLPTCPITCGLDGRVGCGHKHSVFSDHLFSTVDTNPGTASGSRGDRDGERYFQKY